MATGKDRYTTREEVEELLRQTRENADHKYGGEPKAKRRLKPFTIVRRVLYGLLILAMLAMLGKVWYQKLNGQTPSLFGYQMYVVETGSMIPTLPIGSSILVRQLGAEDTLRVGDVITYTHGDAAITHRVVEAVTGEDGVTRYHTKGDNPENSVDPWLVERSDVRGVMIWHFSLAGLFGK